MKTTASHAGASAKVAETLPPPSEKGLLRELIDAFGVEVWTCWTAYVQAIFHANWSQFLTDFQGLIEELTTYTQTFLLCLGDAGSKAALSVVAKNFPTPDGWNNQVVKRSVAWQDLIDLIAGGLAATLNLNQPVWNRVVYWLFARWKAFNLIKKLLALIERSRLWQLFVFIIGRTIFLRILKDLALKIFNTMLACAAIGAIIILVYILDVLVQDPSIIFAPLSQNAPRKKFLLCDRFTDKPVGRIRRREPGGAKP